MTPTLPSARTVGSPIVRFARPSSPCTLNRVRVVASITSSAEPTPVPAGVLAATTTRVLKTPRVSGVTVRSSSIVAVLPAASVSKPRNRRVSPMSRCTWAGSETSPLSSTTGSLTSTGGRPMPSKLSFTVNVSERTSRTMIRESKPRAERRSSRTCRPRSSTSPSLVTSMPKVTSKLPLVFHSGRRLSRCSTRRAGCSTKTIWSLPSSSRPTGVPAGEIADARIDVWKGPSWLPGVTRTVEVTTAPSPEARPTPHSRRSSPRTALSRSIGARSGESIARTLAEAPA